MSGLAAERSRPRVPAPAVGLDRSPHGGIPLAGHSGARIVLLQREGRHIVRKSAATPAQNARLEQQARKQIAFAAAGVRTPEVLVSGHADGLFFFDMAYVPAISIAAQCQGGHVPSGPHLATWLPRWIARLKETTTGTIPPSAFTTKIASILHACRLNPVLDALLPAARMIATLLGQVPWPAIPASAAHGDLTLENILVGVDGELHLIDFDAPDMTSYWLDVAKIYQDLIGYWCIRDIVMQQPGTLAHRNAVDALQSLQRRLDQALAGPVPDLPTILPQLAALHLFRTLPYCREPRTALFVVNRISTIVSGQ